MVAAVSIGLGSVPQALLRKVRKSTGEAVMTDANKPLVDRLRYDCHLATQLGDDARIVLPAIDARTIISRIEAQAAEIEKLKRDHAAAVKEANIAKARLKGVEKQWHADRAALKGSK
jgi:hypothetical protein